MNVAECQSILSPGYTLGSYRIERFLGQGGFGITYLAHDIMLDLPVAIKEYLPEQLAVRTPDGLVSPRSADAKQAFKRGLDGFIKEARTLARFKHPNIVRIMGVFELNGTAYIIMEYEKGQDLKAILGQAGQISQPQLEQIIGPILDGLEEVHRHGFIHRDIKPANIRIRNNGTPVLLDFGAARHQTQNHAGAMTALVSVGYAPMEQYTNEPGAQKQGPWTDIYALGAVLYYAVTGSAPVDSAVRGSALLNDKPDPLTPLTKNIPKGYTPAFCHAIDWAMRFKVSQRPQSLAQWRPRLLQELLNAGGSGLLNRADKVQTPEQNVTALHSNDIKTRLVSDGDTASDSFLNLIDQQLAAFEDTELDESLALQKARCPKELAAAREDSAGKPETSAVDGATDNDQPDPQIALPEPTHGDALRAKQVGQKKGRRKDKRRNEKRLAITQAEQKQAEQKQAEQKQPEQKQPEQKQPEQKQPEQKRAEQKRAETRLEQTGGSERPNKQPLEDVPWEQEPWENLPWERQAPTPKPWESELWEIGDINERSYRQASDNDSTRFDAMMAEPPWLRKTAAVVTGALLIAIVTFFSLPTLFPVKSDEAVHPSEDWVVSSVDTLAVTDTTSELQNDTERSVSSDDALVALSDTLPDAIDEEEDTQFLSDAMQTAALENTAAVNASETAGPDVELAAASLDGSGQVLNVDQSLENDRTVQAAEALRQRELERQRWFGETGPAEGELVQPVASASGVENDAVRVAPNDTSAAILDVIGAPAPDNRAAMDDSQISDRDMAEVLRKFDALSLAIMERDIDAVKELTMPSERKQIYLDYLFSSFEKIEVGVSDIRGSRSGQRITGTIRIREMVRADGERVPPPSEFAAINVYSVRAGDWSKIHW